MSSVSAVPFALGLVGGLLLFAAWLPFAIRDSRRPVRWQKRVRPPVPVVPGELAPTTRAIPRAPQVARPARTQPAFPRVHARVVIVIIAFTLWSMQTSRRRIGDHH